MKHVATRDFRDAYEALPEPVREIAKRSFRILQENPFHPSLRLKRVGRYWSARVNLDYRMLGDPIPEGVAWFWVGDHVEYDRKIKRRKR